jgi:hypothetical protein
MQFIPKTHLPLREAVDQVADIHQGVDPLTAALAKRKLHADLVALEHRAVRAACRKGEPLSEAEDAQLAELRRWRREREDAERFAQAMLRQALGDGDLPSEIMLASGRLTPVRPEAWRTNDALSALETGRLRWRYDSWQAAVIEGPVMIPKAAFAAWLRPSAKPDAAPSPPAATAAGGVAATIAGPTPTPVASAPLKRDKGGRPEREDWASFDREMMRRLALDGGDLTLPAFKRGMKDWAAENMDPVPDDAPIEVKQAGASGPRPQAGGRDGRRSRARRSA